MSELARDASDFAFQIDAASVDVNVENNYEGSYLHIVFSNEEGEKLDDWTCFPKSDLDALRDELEGLIDDAAVETDNLKDKYMV